MSLTSGFIIFHLDYTYCLLHPFCASLLIYIPKLIRLFFCLKSARTPYSFHTKTQAIGKAHTILFDFILLNSPSSSFNISTPSPTSYSELQPYLTTYWKFPTNDFFYLEWLSHLHLIRRLLLILKDSAQSSFPFHSEKHFSYMFPQNLFYLSYHLEYFYHLKLLVSQIGL